MADVTADNKVVVRIYGEDYPVTGGADPQHISRIADLVDSRMKEVAQMSRAQSRDKVAILAAMSMASELQDQSDELSVADTRFGPRLDALISKLDAALTNDSH